MSDITVESIPDNLSQFSDLLKNLSEESKKNSLAIKALNKKLDVSSKKRHRISDSDSNESDEENVLRLSTFTKGKQGPSKKARVSFVDPGPSTSKEFKPSGTSSNPLPIKDSGLKNRPVCQISDNSRVSRSQHKVPACSELTVEPISDSDEVDELHENTGNIVSDAEMLENLLLSESLDPTGNISHSDSSEDFEIPTLGSEPNFNWEPPKKAFAWFQKIADTELTDNQLEDFLGRFVPTDDVSQHFQPPKMPKIIWNQLCAGSSNSAEMYKQRTVFKSQKLLGSSIMPLLTVLESLKGTDPNREFLASAIQMICTSNLQLSRLRRASIAKFVKPEVKHALFSQPVSHLHLFGTDFDSSAELAVKNLSSFQKVIMTPKKKFNNVPSTSFAAPPPTPSSSRTFTFPSSSSSSRTSQPSTSKSPEPSKRKENSKEGTISRPPFRGRGRGKPRGYRRSY